MPLTVGKKIASLVGVWEQEHICCDSVSINLFMLLCCALNNQQRLRPHGKAAVLSLQDNCPTDLYIAQVFSELLGDDRIELIITAEEKLEQEHHGVPAILYVVPGRFLNRQFA